MENRDIPETIQKRGERLAERIDFLGCNVNRFEKTGRTQLEVLIRHGLNPWSRLLDIGCGALSGGYWMMIFLIQVAILELNPPRQCLRRVLQSSLSRICLRSKPHVSIITISMIFQFLVRNLISSMRIQSGHMRLKRIWRKCSMAWCNSGGMEPALLPLSKHLT